VGQDCILQAGFSTGLLVLSRPLQGAPMKSARSLQSCPTGDRRNRLSHQAREEIKIL
jgi:hypothetical protein